ncbi:MAG: GNAT family N-acetyltransferase [bacterium]|nr:GNAT family N-acetyltransferase [bacterium]
MKNLDIIYTNEITFTEEQAGELFLSVDWESGGHPRKLFTALNKADSVYTAWYNNSLIGLINALSDGEMVVYFHYLVVKPAYQKKGIGKKLLTLMLEKYKKVPTKLLISYDEQISFYKKCGLNAGENATPMFISSMITV